MALHWSAGCIESRNSHVQLIWDFTSDSNFNHKVAITNLSTQKSGINIRWSFVIMIISILKFHFDWQLVTELSDIFVWSKIHVMGVLLWRIDFFPLMEFYWKYRALSETELGPLLICNGTFTWDVKLRNRYPGKFSFTFVNSYLYSRRLS